MLLPVTDYGELGGESVTQEDSDAGGTGSGHSYQAVESRHC